MSFNPRPSPPGKLTMREAARRLGISYQAVHRQIQRGTLPAERESSGRWLIAERHVIDREAVS